VTFPFLESKPIPLVIAFLDKIYPAGWTTRSVLRLWNVCRESTFESLKAWAATDESVGCAEIKLCIANRADALREGGAVKRSKWLEDAYEWCTDNMFEYIEVLLT